jgi:hypothetical protein
VSQSLNATLQFLIFSRLNLDEVSFLFIRLNIPIDCAGDHSEASGTSLNFRISRVAQSRWIMLQSPTSTGGECGSSNLSQDSLESPAGNSGGSLLGTSTVPVTPQPLIDITNALGNIFFSVKSQFGYCNSFDRLLSGICRIDSENYPRGSPW